MHLHPTLPDHFGRRYILLTPRHNPPHHALREESFYSAEQALRFIRQLRAPVGYWRRIYQDSAVSFQMYDDARLLDRLSRMLHRGTIKACRVDTVSDGSVPPIGFSDSERTHYALKPVNALLLDRPQELKHFADEPQALAFIKQSGVEEAKLKQLVESEGLQPGKDAFETASKALVAGGLVVFVSRYTRPPKSSDSSVETAPVTDKVATLGPPPDEFKEITVNLLDEFENSLGGAFTSLFDGVEFTLKTDVGEEHKGVIHNGKLHIPKAKMNSNFELKFKDLPAFIEG